MNAEHLLIDQYDGVVDSPEAVSKLRNFIFDLAVHGRLVEQDSNDEPTVELLERISAERNRLTEIIESRKPTTSNSIEPSQFPHSVPDNWSWTQIAQIGLINPKNKVPDNLESSFIPMRLIASEYGESSQHEKHLWKNIKKGYTHFAEGDVGIAKITPCFENGKSTIFRNLTGGVGSGTTELHILRPLIVLSDYVLIFLKRQQFIKNGIQKMTGTAGQKRVPLEFFVHSPFPLPPVGEQHRIVAKVDELMTRCDQLEKKLKEREGDRKRFTKASFASLTESGLESEEFSKRSGFVVKNFDRLSVDVEQIKSLRQIILDLAVRGRIVEQDPNDEPTDELLQRIGIEKQTLIESGEIRIQNFSIDRISKPLFEIPKTWKWVRLCQIGGIIGGGTPRTSDPENFALSGKGIAWITPADLGKLTGLYVDRGQRDISDKGLRSSSARLVPAGSILFSCRAPIGYVAISSNPVSTNQGIKTLVPYISGLSKYVAYVLSHFAVDIDASAPGTTYRELSGKLFSRILIPLPPIIEQKRIVSKVDELMKSCDRLEKVIQSSSESRFQFFESALDSALDTS